MDNGGGINNSATATVSASTFTANFAANVGGGIANGGTVSVSGSAFTANSATTGGGLYNLGTASVSGSTFTSQLRHERGRRPRQRRAGRRRSAPATFTRNSADFGGGLDNVGTATCERQHLHQ